MKEQIDIRRLFRLIVLILMVSLSVCSADSVQAEEGEEEYVSDIYSDPPRTNSIEGWPQGPLIEAESAIVMDMDTSAVLYGKNIETKEFPASITKIMTALVTLEQMGDDLDQVIECPPEVLDLEEGASHLSISPGEELTLRQALYGLMLASANDLGNAIAVHVGGSIEGFADLMNRKAEALGCTNTHFSNPHGLHSDDHYTCARDMALIAQAAYAIPEFRKICSTTEYSIPPTNKYEETRYFEMHHKMVHSSSEYYRDWCTGGKTGFTSAALNTLVTFGEKDEKRLVCVILRVNGAGVSYEETAALMEYGFDSFVHKDMTADLETPTFLKILGLDYPGTESFLQRTPDVRKQTVSVKQAGIVTVPQQADYSLISYGSASGDGLIHYMYSGWPVGTGSLAFTPLPKSEKLPYQQNRDIKETESSIRETEDKTGELRKVGETAFRSIKETVMDWYSKANQFVMENQLMVLLLGALLLLVVLLLIIIIVRRCTRESRIQKKRISEEKARMRAEEEIARKSAVEIEEELRAAMKAEEERKRRQREKEERIRQAEEELREMEEIIDHSNHE